MERKLYQEIAALLEARRNCRKSSNHEWLDRHGAALKGLLAELPSGSGIDNGVKLDEDACTPGKLVFYLGYHHMDDAGMYDGWTEHTLTVTPSFGGIDLKISGRDRNGIKEYLYEVLEYALTRPVGEGAAS